MRFHLHIAPGGAPPRPVPMLARGLSSDAVSQPAIEPGSTRIVISVSGTLQLQ